MNVLQTIKNNKETGRGYTILIVLNIFLIGINIFSLVNNIFEALPIELYVIPVLSLIVQVIFSIVIINLEKKGFSFAAHVLFFITFLTNYLRNFYDFIFRLEYNGLIDLVVLLFGTVASLYTLAKIYVHKDEVKKYIRRVPTVTRVLIVIALIDLYLSESFEMMIIYGLVFVAIMASASAKEALPLIIALSFRVILLKYMPVFIISNQLEFFGLIRVILGIVIELAIIYYALKEYTKKNNDYDNFEYVS